MTPLAKCRLQLLITEALCRLPLEETLTAALDGGVDLLQVREKAGSSQERRAVALRVLEIARPRGVPVLINDDVALAAVLPVAGVHLGQDDETVAVARQRLGPAAWIGRSTHNPQEVRVACQEPVTHLGLGAAYPTATKTGSAPLAPADLVAALASATLPVFVIGGITGDNLPALVAHGVQRIAVSTSILQSSRPEHAARKLRSQLPATEPA